MLRPHTSEDIRALADLVLEAEGFRFELGLPTITISNRFTRYRHGTAWPTENRIVIYWKALQGWDSTAVEDTIRHELAHILDYQNHHTIGHGPGWVEACGVLGAFPRACSEEADVLAFAASNAKKARERTA